MKRLSILISCFLGLSASSVVYANEIRVAGGEVAISAILRPIKDQFEKNTGIKLKLTQSTPSTSLISVMNGTADLATCTLPLEDLIKAVKQSGVKVDKKMFRSTVVGKNKTVIYLHKTNPITSLSKAQIKDIFTGKITNWKSLGGKNEEIKVVYGKYTPGPNAEFTKVMLDGSNFKKKVNLADDYAGVINLVRITPGAIGFGPKAFLTDGINVPVTPPIFNSVIAVTEGEPSADVKMLITHLKDTFTVND